MSIRYTKIRNFDDVGLIFYKISLDAVYALFICGLYGYVKNFQLHLDFFRLFESWMLYLVLIMFTPKRKSITSYFLIIQLVITLSPMLTMYGLSQHSRFFIYLLCGVHCMQCIMDGAIKLPSSIVTQQGKRIVPLLVVVLSLVALALTFLQFGLPGLEALNLGDVYGIRAERTLSFPLTYLVPWFFSVMLPIGILDALSKKKLWMATVYIVAALYFYLVYARKSWFFSIFLILGFYILVKYDLFKKAICWGLPCLVSILTALYYVNEKALMIPSLFVRRLLFVPANIKFEYYNFFCDKSKLYFAEGVIGKLFDVSYPYDKGISFVIGEQMGTPGSSCNTGYLGDAYANLGVFGVVLLAVLLILILKLIDIVSKGQYFVFNFSALSYCLYTLNDSALLTTLLTGGMLLITIMLIIRHESVISESGICNEKVRMQYE